jgi:putative hemolysin
MPVAWEMLVILGLILANGFFAAAEIAILTARRSRLEKQAESGDRAARIALELARNPQRFLSTAQAGITLVGTLAAVFGGAALVRWLADLLAEIPLGFVVTYREALALGIVALGIAFCSLLLGELVPKRLALGNAERLARLVAVPMHRLAQAARPVVWLMGAASEGVLALLGARAARDASVSVEDIEHLIRAGTRQGILEPAEQMVARKALRLGDRTVREIMRPRIDIDALDVDTPPDEVIGAVAMSGFSRLPVHEGDLDHIIGFVYTKDLLLHQHMGWPVNLRKLVRPALLVPETLSLDKLLELFRRQRTQMAIVLDEFGGTEGLATLEDVLEELVGEIHDEHRLDRQQQIIERGRQSWLVDGGVNIDDLLERIGLGQLRPAAPREFSTVAGLVLFLLGRIPRVGDRATWHGIELEVVAMDGQAIDRLLVSLVPEGPGQQEPVG